MDIFRTPFTRIKAEFGPIVSVILAEEATSFWQSMERLHKHTPVTRIILDLRDMSCSIERTEAPVEELNPARNVVVKTEQEPQP